MDPERDLIWRIISELGVVQDEEDAQGFRAMPLDRARSGLMDVIRTLLRQRDEARAAVARVRDDLARAIWEEEQRCQEAIVLRPTNPHLNGRLLGLQRARDIAKTEDF